MRITPLEHHDAAALAALGADVTSWLTTPSGRGVHTLGAWVDDVLVAAVELTPMSGPRRRHVGELRVAARADAGGVTAVVGAMVDLADRWLGLLRLEVDVAADEPARLAAVRAAGLDVEVVRPAHVRRGTGFVDGLALGRLRPGWVPPPPGPPPPWPSRRAAPTRVVVRPTEIADAAAIAASMREPLVTRGTLQVPSTSADSWALRLGGGAAWAVIVDDEHVAANGGLHVLPAPSAHVAMFGMSVAGAWQGCGLGHLLLRHLIADARNRGLRRLALEVFTDNPRAEALYAAHGFVADGVRPAEATCDGGYADSRAMSRDL